MARTPIADRPLIAQWLIRARLTQGEGYRAERFLADLASEEGHAPHRSTYAQWESGAVTPEPSSLAPVVAFWDRRGVAGPTTSQPDAPLSVEAQQLAELKRAADAAERQAAALEFIAWTLSRQQGPTPATPEEVEPIQAFVSGLLGRIAPRLPTAPRA